MLTIKSLGYVKSSKDSDDLVVVCCINIMSAISSTRHREPRQALYTGQVVTTAILPTASSLVYEYRHASSNDSANTVVAVTVAVGVFVFCLALFVLYRCYMINYDRALLRRQREKLRGRFHIADQYLPSPVAKPRDSYGNTRKHLGKVNGWYVLYRLVCD